MCTCTIPGKYRPNEEAIKWFEATREPGKGEKIRREKPLKINAKILTTIVITATLMDTLRKNFEN